MAGKVWTKEEIKFLEENFEEMSCKEIAEKIGRTTRSVQHKFGELKLQRSPQIKVGDKFEYLTVQELKMEYYSGQNKTIAYCQCKCGNSTRIVASELRRKPYSSCGCIKRKKASERLSKYNEPKKHGLTDHKLYKIWYGMKTRCTNPNQLSYKDYGGRGITVCDEWFNNFLKFYEWSLSNGYKEGLSLDRIDNDSGYHPKNCRWVTPKDQAWNRRNTIKQEITAFGETKTVHDWAEDNRCTVNANTLIYRIGANWNPEISITKPPERKSKRDGIYSLGLCRFVQKNYPAIVEEFKRSQE